ncbi:MAG: TldD/PmbA family protein [Candidatus Zophobacter franzmannii]|nr:TldD/PmbA family protein [Candidatus Zophobacter franzmannii]
MNPQMRKVMKQIIKDYPQLKLSIGYEEWQTDFLRFFNSQVNYNISKQSISVGVSAYEGKKQYSFGITEPSEAKIRDGIENAITILKDLPGDPDFVDLEDNTEVVEPKKIPNNIETLSLEKKIEILEKIAKVAESHGFGIYGTFICNAVYYNTQNSNGVDKEDFGSPIMLELKAVKHDTQVTVLETFGSENFDHFELQGFIDRLEKKIIAAKLPIEDVDAGYYEVVLAPRCIGEFLFYFEGSMSANSYDTKASFFLGKEEEQLFPMSINVSDQPDHPFLIHKSYYDGHPANSLELIKEGKFANWMCSNYYAHKTGLPKNGNHGKCLVMQTGDKSIEEMIGSVKKGIYISSLHYMNFINSKETSLTGLTRDGTFLIEDGKITKVLNNLRFTEKISNVLEYTTEIEKESYTVPWSNNYGTFGINSSRTPHVKVSKFQISSSTHTI